MSREPAHGIPGFTISDSRKDLPRLAEDRKANPDAVRLIDPTLDSGPASRLLRGSGGLTQRPLDLAEAAGRRQIKETADEYRPSASCPRMPEFLETPNNFKIQDIYWCPGKDSNLHGLHRWYLKPVRLPIPPPGPGGLICRGARLCQRAPRFAGRFFEPSRSAAIPPAWRRSRRGRARGWVPRARRKRSERSRTASRRCRDSSAPRPAIYRCRDPRRG